MAKCTGWAFWTLSSVKLWDATPVDATPETLQLCYMLLCIQSLLLLPYCSWPSHIVIWPSQCEAMAHSFRHWGLGRLGSLWLRHNSQFRVVETSSTIGAGKEARLTRRTPCPGTLVTNSQAKEVSWSLSEHWGSGARLLRLYLHTFLTTAQF